LQLPMPELEATLLDALERNVMLEARDGVDAASSTPDAYAAGPSPAGDEPPAREAADTDVGAAQEAADVVAVDGDGDGDGAGDWEDWGTGGGRSGDGEADWPDDRERTLRGYLLEQLRVERFDGPDLAVALALVD